MAQKPNRRKIVKASTSEKSYEEAALPDKPSEKHTVLITCTNQDCTKKRWCKPQDAWQVRLCVPCRDEKKKAKLVTRLAAVREKAEAKAVVIKHRAFIPRLEVFKFIWATAQDRAKWPKMKRIWA